MGLHTSLYCIVQGRIRAMSSSDVPALQLILPDQTFNPRLAPFMSKFSGVGRSFNVVAIIGGQSTGKSTLMNTMFGTGFGTMDASKGRQQTTRGIWLSKCSDQDLLLLDVEGADGREAGEKKAFENRSALFSLALTDV